MRPIFSDVTDSNEWSWCYKHVQYLCAEGLISGYPGGLHHPEHLCSRDQMAVYIANAFMLPLAIDLAALVARLDRGAHTCEAKYWGRGDGVCEFQITADLEAH